MADQTYLGNEKHQWEAVTPAPITSRLRVPGGWLYRAYNGAGFAMAFVPMPEVVKHKV